MQHDINSKIIELQEKIDSKLTEAHQKYKELEHENATLKRRLKIVEKKSYKQKLNILRRRRK